VDSSDYFTFVGLSDDSRNILVQCSSLLENFRFGKMLQINHLALLSSADLAFGTGAAVFSLTT
jgi:hypothetical protein